MSETLDKVETQDTVAVGQIVELLGRMPTLANAACVFAMTSLMLEKSDKSAAKASATAFRARIDEFSKMLAAIKDGSDDVGISAETAANLQANLFSDSLDTAVFNQFVSQSYFIHTLLKGPGSALPEEVMDLASMVTGDLTETLQDLILKASELLTRLNKDQNEERSKGRNLTTEAVKNLNDLTRQIQLISVNASIEASRLGQEGRTFGVIAEEIKALSHGAQARVNEISKTLKSG